MRQWSQFNCLWENETYEKKDVNNINLLDSEAALCRHHELEMELKTQPDKKAFGTCFVISIGNLELRLLLIENSRASFYYMK